MKPEGEKIINYMKEHCEDPIKFKVNFDDKYIGI